MTHHLPVRFSISTGSESTILERGEYKARPALERDIEDIAASMRPADMREVEAISGQTPREALEHSFELSSLCRTLCYRDTPLIMYGTCEVSEFSGVVWGLGSTALDDHVMGFLRVSKAEVETLQAHYEQIFNFVHADNELHLKWVEYVGFTLFDPVIHESGETVIPIQRSR